MTADWFEKWVSTLIELNEVEKTVEGEGKSSKTIYKLKQASNE